MKENRGYSRINTNATGILYSRKNECICTYGNVSEEGFLAIVPKSFLPLEIGDYVHFQIVDEEEGSCIAGAAIIRWIAENEKDARIGFFVAHSNTEMYSYVLRKKARLISKNKNGA